jgi:hypothetical protein
LPRGLERAARLDEAPSLPGTYEMTDGWLHVRRT